ncbi:MAG: DUF5671 domain-containing protein [Candidatus Pacebacteria bacterium]|jgi:hypothetical protein|nr:hypothetical protein [bacterium]MDP6527787.1 DUF5671 domain-containing protein [Candidatus Paceibacterota bacterium]MDP6659624.1 DUF5671 domain-containing protein [Candidatus Paceibacterota bacterium]|tara:strand:- start:52332 stop:53261 length:930 start_codon:yes stop_codon:yes gene_type:complete
MEHKAKMTPKDFFLWVAATVALYVSAVSLLALLFEYIDVVFADPLRSYQFSGPIRFAMASLIIIFPLYIYLTRKLNQDIRVNPEKKDIGIRKWLLFLTLFIAGITIVIDLIVLINTFLGGQELTTAFLLKVLSVLVVIGGIFFYYLKDLKGKWEREPQMSKNIGWLVSAVVLLSIVGGFFIIGSPQTQRLLRIDQEKVNDLSSIQHQITSFYQQKERLPRDLDELSDPLVGFILPTDPQTDENYGYSVKGTLTFELCAEFNKESSEKETRAIRTPFGKVVDSNWAHGVGEVCFERTIDPDKFPPLKLLR